MTQIDWAKIGLHVGVLIVLAVVVHVVVRWAVRRLVAGAKHQAAKRRSDQIAAAADAAIVPGSGETPTVPLGVPADDRAVARTATLGHGLGLVVDVVLGVVVVLTVLGEFGVNLAPLLASAGIGGIALAFGAQSLVKDVLSGVFLVIEDQFGLGDAITVGAIFGTVESVGLRVTRLRDASGQVWYVRNGEIATLGNKTQGSATSQVQLSVPVGADPFAALTRLRTVAEDLADDPTWRPRLLAPPQVLGLTSVDVTQMTFAVQVRCPADALAAVERELRLRGLAALQAGDQPPV
ncbi:MAG: mechanosensitive ion channel family protein [Actinomycetia bacterium]|nr:mechanosensitive ion channel family protein [Actinomycetes bacterium]